MKQADFQVKRMLATLETVATCKKLTLEQNLHLVLSRSQTDNVRLIFRD